MTRSICGSVTVFLIYTFYIIHFCESRRNNVCKNFADYRTIQYNPNCWFNPDVDATPEEIVKRYGYPFESYEVKTQDGYFLTLFRIPHNGSNIDLKRPVVFFQHGIAADGLTWMTSGAKSIVFVFANKGFDVWISNCRGTEYSSKHIQYTVYDRDFWIFSFHELALYDVPAMLDFISQKTGEAGKITYVGHSMGCTIALIYSSVMSQHAKSNLKNIVALAPVAYMDHVQTIARTLVPYRYLVWELFSSIGLYGIGLNVQFKTSLLNKLCASYPLITVCAAINSLVSGVNLDEAMASSFPLGIRRFPIGVSLKTILHYAQILAEKRRFQFFDYGPELNPKIYNSSLPPEYPLENIQIPINIFYGKRDLLAAEKDVIYLYEKLQTEKTIMEVYGFGHLEFLSATHSYQFYKTLLKYA